ncbi:amino acid--[acyl-carrier-protein] ligase [Humibacter sp.]|uniref:amino acid--[acyl-carrier-protein] ligase n=1 Tax=Humibacter sp. TaxID=1940291 RepID=UPI003F7E4488
MTIESERRAFRNQLIEAGILVSTGVDGLYLRSGAFERIVRGVEQYVSRSGSDEAAEQYFFPPITEKASFERTDYIKSFPDLLGVIDIFHGGDEEHAELIFAFERGADWTRDLVSADVVMAPAACHALYPRLTGVLPEGGKRFEVQGYCFRHEPSIDPTRMQSFRMHEFVYVGDPTSAAAYRAKWIDRAEELFTRLALDVEVEEANDPFFGRAGRMLAANQRATALKFEVTCPVSSTQARTAIASANYHESHFGESFDIRTTDGNVAHSACVGFGLERIALALLKEHGLRVDGWPKDVQASLWP